MPIFDVSAARAFGFKSNPGAFGHLTSLQIGGDKLDADISLETPSGGTVTVVGALSDIAWGIGDRPEPNDPIYFLGEISSENAIRVKALLLRTQPEIRVTFSFTVYDYDFEEKTYFVACQGAADETPLKSHFRVRRDGTTTLAVADEGAAPVPGAGIELFALQAQVMPEQIAQTILVRASPTRQTTKTWQEPGAGHDAAVQEQMAGTKA
jgi:hypothetical protein